MTTTYPTKESALETGLYYAGFGDAKLRKRTLDELPEPVKEQVGWPQDKMIETYQITTPAGKEVKIGIGKLREGFDLWLINPESGIGQRT